MPTYETELLKRVAALQIAAMASINIRADAKPYFYHVQESFPYFTNRIVTNPIGDNGSQDEDLNNPLVIMRLIVAHVTEGFKGEPEGKLYEWGPIVKTYIQERSEWLIATGYPNRMDNLQSARITDAGGFRVFSDSGLSVNQVGRELQMQCIFDEHIEQVYY